MSLSKPLVRILIALVVGVGLAGTPTLAQECAGDCDHDGVVTVDELVTAVNIALGTFGVSECPEFDSSGDGQVTVDELIHGVDRALAGCSIPPFSPSPSLYPGRKYGVGPGPLSVAVADLNADEVPDLVIANSGNDLSVLIGVGNGTFATEQHYDAGDGAGPLVVVDLNADGVPDLVTANADPDSPYGVGGAWVLLGAGDGTFATARRYGVGYYPVSLAVADLNADGVPDLVTANRGSNDVSVLIGVGDGTFATERYYGSGDEPRSVAVADLNADGVLDLVTANLVTLNGFSGDVSVLLGVGDGTFAREQRYDAGDGSGPLVVVDLNADDVPDLVAANRGSNDVSVLLGVGDGTFVAEQRYGTGRAPEMVAVADLNTDGVADLVTANYSSNDVSVLLGVGDGTFVTERRYGAGDDPGRVAVADLNEDDVPDLMTANGANGNVSVLLGVGYGTFATAQHYGVGAYPFSMAVVDLNADGVPDLVTVNNEDSDVSVLLGVGDGTFASDQRYAAGKGTSTVAVADLNADGAPDLVTANLFNLNEDRGDVSVLLGAGDGTFATAHHYGVGAYPESVAVADLNADGVPDLVAANANREENQGEGGVSVMLGASDGTFATETRYGASDDPRSVAVADLNADGVPDLVTANFFGAGISGGNVSVFLGVGDGTFATAQHYGVGNRPTSVAVADVNADDVPDLVTANFDSSDVSVRLGVGDGTFATAQHYGVGDEPRSVAVADLNGDGMPDLVAAANLFNLNEGRGDSHGRYRAFPGVVSVLLGVGDGTFATAQHYDVGGDPRSVAVADLNADDVPDLVTASGAGVSVLLGVGDGSFASEQRYGAGVSPGAVAVADLNADDVPDLVTANGAGVSVLLGLPRPPRAPAESR